MAANKTRRQGVLEAIVGRLEAITTANGFATNAGRAVFLGELPTLGPDDDDVAIVVLAGEEVVRWHGANIAIELTVMVHVVARSDRQRPWVVVEEALGDVKRAIELEDRRLGGLLVNHLERGSVETMPTESGVEVVGLMIPYRAPIVEAWGRP